MDETTPQAPTHRPEAGAHAARGAALTTAALTTAAALGWLAAASTTRPNQLHLPVVAAALLLVGARLLHLPVQLRIPGVRRAWSLELSPWAAALVVAAAGVRPGAVVVMAVAAALVAAIAWRDRPLHALVAMAGAAAGASASALVVGVTAARLAATGGWPLVAAAAAAAVVAETAVVTAAARPRPGVDLAQTAVAVVTGTAVAVVAVDAAASNPWSLLLLAAAAAGAAAGHASHRRLAGRHADLAALHDLTQRLAARSEERDVLREVLLGLEQALSCSRAQLLVQRRSGVLRYELDDSGAMTVQELHAPPPLVGLVVDGRDAVVAPRGARHHLGRALQASGFDDAMVVRLPTDGGDPRMLVVANRSGPTFGPSDLPFLQTLAAQCAVSLRGTRLLGELKAEVASREHDALHDALTRLGNRTLFTRRCREALARRRPSSGVVVMLMDLDGFKDINDTLGHHVGDHVLQEVARRLRSTVGGRGVPTRLGGDEFAIVYPAVGPDADVEAAAQAISDAVSRPMTVGDLSLTVQASIGISMAPAHGSDTSGLLKCADVAMYSAKSSSRRVAVYSATSDSNSTRRLVLASDLRRALDAEELAVHYQPKADLRTGAVLGFEALLRWSHPTLGEVSPTEFIPIAEQAGLIDGLTWWVLAEALHQQQVWATAGHDLSVSVNISARSLLDGRLAARLSRLLASSGVPPERLILEVTETSVMADAERSAAVLNGAAALGVRISVDDFGTGYSSLSRLLEMPVHEIKVDQSFVTTMLRSSDNMAIVQSTVQLALSMGRMVTAEGVEDEGTWEALRAMGCHAAQGFTLARPMVGERTLVWLAEHDLAMAAARSTAASDDPNAATDEATAGTTGARIAAGAAS